MSKYDAWLEAPYRQREQDQEAYERFCEEFGYAYDDDAAEGAFRDHMEDVAQDMADAAAEARAEARMERDDY